MRGRVFYNDSYCGLLEKIDQHHYRFTYDEDYTGPPISLTMPPHQKTHTFQGFPPFFDGLLPEGVQLEALLRSHKLDVDDYLGQLLVVGSDLVGAVTVLLDNPQNHSEEV